MSPFFLLALCASGTLCALVDVRACNNLAGTGINLTDVDIDHVVLSEEMTIKFRLNTGQVLNDPKLQFILDAKGREVPCSQEKEVGSCTYSLCGKKEFNVESSMCTPWKCECPIKPGSYKHDGIHLTLPTFSKTISRIVTRSAIEVTLKIEDPPASLFCGTFAVRAIVGNKFSSRADESGDEVEGGRPATEHSILDAVTEN